jgi:hypothetical protein
MIKRALKYTKIQYIKNSKTYPISAQCKLKIFFCFSREGDGRAVEERC